MFVKKKSIVKTKKYQVGKATITLKLNDSVIPMIVEKIGFICDGFLMDDHTYEAESVAKDYIEDSFRERSFKISPNYYINSNRVIEATFTLEPYEIEK
jgi:hypothetical protein